MEFVKAIRDRRERAAVRALTMLDMYGASDAATRASLLQAAAKSLTDARVAERLIGLLSSEQDQGMRTMLLRHLAALDFRQVPQTSNCLAQLLACVDAPDTREWALYCISRIAPHDPQLIPPLIAAYRSQRDAVFKQRILAMLFVVNNPPPELIEFFISVLDEVEVDVKTALVRRLLERDMLPIQALERLLSLTEPSDIKVQVLDHMVDRSIAMDDRAVELLRRDPDPACRYAAAWSLTESGTPRPGVVEALLDAACTDPDEHVREFAITAFSHTLARTPDIVMGLLDSVKRETSASRVRLILSLLTPYLQRTPEAVSTLTGMLEQNIQTEIALEMYAALGALAPWNAALLDWLIAACTREKEDRIKAAILKPLSQIDPSNPRVAKLCSDALRMPEPEIQRWGVQGILSLPSAPENTAAIAEGAAILLSPDIPLDLRLLLSQKLAVIPDKTPELLARLKETAEQSRDSQLKKTCEDAVNKTTSDADPNEARIDWADWIHRAEIEHRGDGIFPAMYEHYNDAPDSARRVLKALLNPQCENSLYGSYGYDVNEGSILNFLDLKNAIDDDVSRHCIGRILTQTAGTPDGYLQHLASNPAFKPLKENVLQIIEKREDASPALLRSLLVAAYGGDDAAALALSERTKSARSAEALAPFVRVVIENLGWPPAQELLLGLSHHQALAGKPRQAVADALKKFPPADDDASAQLADSKEEEGAGFADE